MKIVLLVVGALLMSQHVLAASLSITCPVGVITATDKFEDDQQGEAKKIELMQTSENLFEGEVKLMNKTFAMRIHKDEYMDLYEVSTVLLDENNEKLALDGFLLKYSGKGDGNWHGPQGMDFLAIIDGSLQELPARFVITWNAFKILNTYGVTSRFHPNPYQIQVPISNAIKDGKLQKGEIISMGIVLGCSLEK